MIVKIEAKIKGGIMTAFREKYKLTQKEAAEMAGVTLGVWGNAERLNFKDTDRDSLRKIASLLEVDVKEICPPEFADKDMRTKRAIFQEMRAERIINEQAKKRLICYESNEDCKTPQELKEILKKVLNCLTYRQRKVIELRYGIGHGHEYTYEEIGKMLKMTRERARQIVEMAIERLKVPERVKKLKDALTEK